MGGGGLKNVLAMVKGVGKYIFHHLTGMSLLLLLYDFLLFEIDGIFIKNHIEVDQILLFNDTLLLNIPVT